MAPKHFVGSVLHPLLPCCPSLKRWILLVAVILLIWPSAEGQGRNNVWALGDSILLEMGPAGFEFSRSIPFYGRQGVTSICDTAGNLLYYANSKTVINRNDDTLQNGQNLTEGFPNMVQGCLTIPVPGTLDRYYIFTLEAKGGPRNSLMVSVVDMNLDGGLGGILPGFKSKLLASNVGEMLNVVRHGNGKDWWVFVCPLKSDSIGRTQGILRFRATSDSILGPFFQDIGRSNGPLGEIVVSSDGRQLAISAYSSPLIQVFSFDRCSGLLSNAKAIYDALGGSGYLGIAFGPESQVLYGIRSDPRIVNQFFPDGDGYIQHEIVRYGTKVNHFLSTPELGPDGRVYVASGASGVVPDTTTYYLGVVQEPTLEGMACSFDTFGVWLGGASYEAFGLPNQANFDLGILEGSPCDTSSTAITDWGSGSAHWSVYPNPAMDRFCLVGEGEAQHASVVLYDAQGREVWQTQDATSSYGNTHCYTLSEALPPGSYLLRVMADEASENIRLQVGP
jgi:hypothetical protein